MKPILFNTEMVKAILDGRKTVTRQVCKIVINGTENVKHPRCYSIEYPSRNKNGDCAHFLDAQGHFAGSANQPYRPGDILYVRETWNSIRFGNGVTAPFQTEYWYKADDTSQNPDDKWRPSIHMPKEAARLFLRVTDVRVERLQDITELQILEEEGIKVDFPQPKPSYISLAYVETRLKPAVKEAFSKMWDSTIKKADLPRYGWDANPWVWVIEFERISKEAALKGGAE